MHARTPRGRLPLRLFVAAWLLGQLALPLPGLLRDRTETRGNFSWNMFADGYTCNVRYAARDGAGGERVLDYDGFFRDEASSAKALHRDVLPEFHAWLCREKLPAGSQLRGLVSCSLNGGPWIDLVPPNTDLCRAEGD